MDSLIRKILGYLATILGGIGAIGSAIAFGLGFIKAGFLFILFTIIPIVFYYCFTMILEGFLEVVVGILGDMNISAQTIQLAGMGGWVAQQINLTQCFSVFMTFLSLRATLNIITFRL
jgi:hypothetical protein